MTARWKTDQPLTSPLWATVFSGEHAGRRALPARRRRDAAGSLVTGDGFAVLDASGAPITLADGQLAAASDGTLTVDGQPAGQLGLAAFTDPTVDLARDPVSGNMFVAVNAPAGTDPGSVLQGHLEMANVDAAQAMTQMIAVGRAYEAAQRMVQANDDLLGKAIQSLGSW
jgi:flagellar basal-body rod protein FlgG